MNDIPRRQIIDMQTPTERVICNAMHAVEALGYSPPLVDAREALRKAFNAVADWTDVQGIPIAAADVDASPGAKFLPGFVSITDENGTFTPPVANLNYGKAEPIAPNVVELGPHSKMTPEQALAYCSREQWDDVIIIGYHKSAKSLSIRSSHMSRECTLWLAEHFILSVLDLS
jgi:hypothetical protein